MESLVLKPWGHEKIWARTDKYVGKILHIKSGHRLSLQYHVTKDETIHVQKGTLLLEYGSDVDCLTKYSLNAGDSFHIKVGMIHRMSAVTDVDVYEVSTAELDDVLRLEDDYGRCATSSKQLKLSL